MQQLQPRVVLFDLGSTLIEYESITWSKLTIECIASAGEFLSAKGHQVPPSDELHLMFEEVKRPYRDIAAREQIEWTIPQAAADLLDRLRISYDDALVDGFFDAYYEPVEEQLYVFDDTVETLELVKRRYPAVGLISNTIFPERAHLKELERFGIEPFLDFKVFSSTFGLRKPHPDIFINAANQAGVAPSECVYIGDRFYEDVQGPRGVGMAAILKYREGRDYPDEWPDWLRRIDQLSQLPEQIEI